MADPGRCDRCGRDTDKPRITIEGYSRINPGEQPARTEWVTKYICVQCGSHFKAWWKKGGSK